MLKMGQLFHICIRSGLRALTSPPPPLTVKIPFFTTFLIKEEIVCEYGK